MKKLELVRQQALQFLSQRQVMVISTVSRDGKPESATVYYKLDPANWHLYFMTGMETQKYKNIVENPFVSFVVGTGPQIFTI